MGGGARTVHARVQKLTPAGGGHSKDRERNPDCPLFPLEDGKLQLVENENEEHQTSPPPGGAPHGRATRHQAGPRSHVS